ncbi:MAG: GUN4 domain-containing protein [Microcoleus sp. SIO2G3]|nr:GUN4 domain-containing protein [Microcoleus sp. SIO2G3]
MSFVAREILQQKQKEIGITDGLAAEIESQVLEPYRKRLKNLEVYREAFKKAVEYLYPLAQKTRDELKDLQDVFGLRDEDVEPIQEQITADKEAEYQQQQEAQRRQQEQAKAEQQQEVERRRQQQPLTPKIPSKPPAETDDLSSERGVDYTKLRDLLASGQWKEADQETLAVMLKAAGREGYLDAESIEKFPCTDLRTIDRLWVKYSDGRFGFSVQKRIWESVGGQPGESDYVIYQKFGYRVDWRVRNVDTPVPVYWDYSNFSFSLKTSGHLPWWWLGWWRSSGGQVVSSLVSRLVKCNI